MGNRDRDTQPHLQCSRRTATSVQGTPGRAQQEGYQPPEKQLPSKGGEQRQARAEKGSQAVLQRLLGLPSEVRCWNRGEDGSDGRGKQSITYKVALWAETERDVDRTDALGKGHASRIGSRGERESLPKTLR
jgi:hypothetical protein